MFISKGFKFIAGAIIPILVLAQTAMAAPGDFYDTTTSLHYYSAAGLNDTTKAQLTAAYAGGDKFVKERADGTYLDYNGAYALFSQELQGGNLSLMLLQQSKPIRQCIQQLIQLVLQMRLTRS